MEIKKASGARIRTYSIARKGKSDRTFEVFSSWTPQLVLLVGHLLFDGGIRASGCEYNNRSEALIARVEILMRQLYDFAPNRYLNAKTGVTKISYNNVALASYLARKSDELLEQIGELSIACQKEFIRAFFDDEGCIDFRPSSRRRSIRGYQKDIAVLHIVRKLLENISIQSRIVAPNEIVLVGKESLERFHKEINFSKGVIMNGDRSNSRWKEDVEKRELLERAILSYKN